MNIISKKNALSSCTDNVSDVKNEIGRYIDDEKTAKFAVFFIVL